MSSTFRRTRLLSKYNGGQGVSLAASRSPTPPATKATVDLSTGTFKTLGDVISAINAKSLERNRLDQRNGNGLLLTDNPSEPAI